MRLVMTNDPYAIVYRKHCTHCKLRNVPCAYENCSELQFENWVKEAQKEINKVNSALNTEKTEKQGII